MNPTLFSSDVQEFTRAIADGQLVAALELWRGDPLPGFHVSDCAELGARFDDARMELKREAAGAAWAFAPVRCTCTTNSRAVCARSSKQILQRRRWHWSVRFAAFPPSHD